MLLNRRVQGHLAAARNRQFKGLEQTCLKGARAAVEHILSEKPQGAVLNRNLQGKHRDPREAQAAEEMTRLESPQAVL